MQNHRSPLAFCAALLLLLLSVASCKKQEDPNAAGASFALEKLGDLTLNKGNLGFNLAGEPLIQVNAFVYEWSNTNKAWRKIGGAVSAQTVNNGIKQYAQDKRGIYYISDGSFIYSCANATDNWVKVNFPGIRGGTFTSLLANDLGDIVTLIVDDAIVYQFFTKKSTSAVWSPVASTPYDKFGDQAIYYFCNSGVLYLSESGFLKDTYLDTNTGRFAMLYDKSDPVNVPLGKAGYIYAPYVQIHPSGTVYMWKDNDLFKFDGAVLPAKITKVRTFDNPLKSKHDVSWTNSFSSFAITEAGDIKVMGSCNKYPQTHFSHITGNSGKSGMQLLQDNMDQRSMYVNRKNECFFLFYPNTGLYKWN